LTETSQNHLNDIGGSNFDLASQTQPWAGCLVLCRGHPKADRRPSTHSRKSVNTATCRQLGGVSVTACDAAQVARMVRSDDTRRLRPNRQRKRYHAPEPPPPEAE